MQSSVCVFLAAIVASTCAQVYVLPGHEDDKFPPNFHWEHPAGRGRVFGTLGSTDQGLFGRGGYQQQIFNDNRGKLEAQAHGTRILGASGDSSHFGGRVDWSNKNAEAAVDVSKQIGGRTSVAASGSGVWNIDKNTHMSAGGTYQQDIGHGKADVGVQAKFQHDW